MTKDKDKKRESVAEAIQSKFLEERKIFLWGEVSDKSEGDLTEKLLYLEAESPGKEITFYINSPGGQLLRAWPFLTLCNLLVHQLQLLLLAWLRAWVLYFCVVQPKETLSVPSPRVLIINP